jgi:hypothetical protein
MSAKESDETKFKRINDSIEFLRAADDLFDRLPEHERRADLNWLLDKYVHNPSKELRERDQKWREENQ